MEALPEELYRELKPVTIYFGDLLWIEVTLQLLNHGVDMNYIDSDNEEQYIIGVENLTTHDSIVGLDKLDNLEFNNYDYFVWFQKNKTIVRFTKINKLSRELFEDICNRLEKKQRVRKNQKQRLYLYHKHVKRGNFLTQDKVPLWLAILIGLLPSLLAIYALLRK